MKGGYCPKCGLAGALLKAWTDKNHGELGRFMCLNPACQGQLLLDVPPL